MGGGAAGPVLLGNRGSPTCRYQLTALTYRLHDAVMCGWRPGFNLRYHPP